MKKEYMTPTMEKITFNYRDQVVVASGGTSTASEDGGSRYPWEYSEDEWRNAIQNWNFELTSVSACRYV